jgi:hypothetical protein
MLVGGLHVASDCVRNYSTLNTRSMDRRICHEPSASQSENQLGSWSLPPPHPRKSFSYLTLTGPPVAQYARHPTQREAEPTSSCSPDGGVGKETQGREYD